MHYDVTRQCIGRGAKYLKSTVKLLELKPRSRYSLNLWPTFTYVRKVMEMLLQGLIRRRFFAGIRWLILHDRTKLLRIYQSKMKTINLSKKVDKFIVFVRRYRAICCIELQNDKRKSADTIKIIDIKQKMSVLYKKWTQNLI